MGVTNLSGYRVNSYTYKGSPTVLDLDQTTIIKAVTPIRAIVVMMVVLVI